MSIEHPDHVVVVGASLAGVRAAESARRSGYTGRITLVGAEQHEPYNRPYLSKTFMEPIDDGGVPQVLPLRSAESLRDDLGVELLLGSPATALDVEGRTVFSGERAIPYDSLVIATGSEPRRLALDGGLDGVYSLRTLDDARRIRSRIAPGARVVIIGAGFIGSELASSARAHGAHVTIIEALPTPLVRAVGAMMGSALTALHERHGTTVLLGASLAAIEGVGGVERVVLADGRVEPADVVIVGIGIVPAVGWLEGAGLDLDNGIVCDEFLRTSAPGVYAAGDVANWFNPVAGHRQRLENWTSASEQGLAAGRNASMPEQARAFGTVPYFWSDWYGVRIQFVGSAEADEVAIVDGNPGATDHGVVLYRRGDQLAGVLALSGQSEIMKYRALLGRGATWDEGIEFSAERRRIRAAHAAQVAGVGR